MLPTAKEALVIGLVAVAFLAIVFRTPAAAYVTGEKKILGLV